MITDIQLAEYIEGEMAAEARQRFEIAASVDDKAIAQLVAQQRLHHTLQFLSFSAHPEPDPRLKHAIMALACGKDLGNGSSESSAEIVPRKWQTEVIAAAILVAVMVLISAAIWVFAPRP